MPGVGPEDGVVDVGYGLHPDLVGGGHGRPLLRAVLDFGRDRFDVGRFRALVLDWNERSLATCRSAGFDVTGHVTTARGRFVVLERGADDPGR